MNTENKNSILHKIENEGLIEKANNSGGRMEKNEFRKLVIQVKCTEDIEKTISDLSNQIEKSSISNKALSSKICWLNFILAAATIVIAAGTLLTIYLEYFKNNA